MKRPDSFRSTTRFLTRAIAMIAIAAALFGQAMAQTPGGTSITNQASATYAVQAQEFAYVPNFGNGSVSVINPATNTVVTTISDPVFGRIANPFAAAAMPNGTRVYVTDAGTGNVFVIDAATNAVVAFIPVGASPTGLAITPDGKFAYVANYGDNSVSVIDTTTNTVIKTISDGANPWGVAVTPDGTHVYVTNQDQKSIVSSVSVIRTSDNTVLTTIPVGGSPSGIAITPDGTRAFVANDSDNTVSVIDTTHNTVLTTINNVANPWVVAITPNGTRAYVTNQRLGQFVTSRVSVIDTANYAVTTVSVPNPWGMAITPAGLAFVTNQDQAGTTSSVSVIDTTTNAMVGNPIPLPPGSDPQAVAFAGVPPTISNTPPTTNSDNTVTLSWNPSSSATSYGLKVTDIGANSVVVNTVVDPNVSGTSYTTPPLSADTQYQWGVSACNTAGCGSYTVLYFQTSSATVTSSKNPSNFGDSVNFTATVSPNTATGTVQFKIDGIIFGAPVTVISGSATSGNTSSLPVGSHLVTAVYSGDSNFAGSTGTLTQTVNQAAATAPALAFVIGDLNAVVGNKVTFWGAQWAKLNSLSGVAAPEAFTGPDAFKGFANSTSTKPPACGGTWKSDPGNSSGPPSSVPAYITVIVASSITKSGSIIAGNITRMAVIKTNPGYDSNPGHAGTGTVVSIVCTQAANRSSAAVFDGRFFQTLIETLFRPESLDIDRLVAGIRPTNSA